MKVDFVTYCCEKDVRRFRAPGMLKALVESCDYPFDEVFVIQQDCRHLEGLEPFGYPHTLLETEDFSGEEIRAEFGIREDNPHAELASPPTASQYWKNMTLNPLIGLKISDADYVTFCDCDIVIEGATAGSWVRKGIEVLRKHRKAIMVAPGHGNVVGNEFGENIGGMKIISQIAFVCERERFKTLNLDLSGEGDGHFYFVFEGRIQRYCERSEFRRAMLPPPWGVIHHYAW